MTRGQFLPVHVPVATIVGGLGNGLGKPILQKLSAPEEKGSPFLDSPFPPQRVRTTFYGAPNNYSLTELAKTRCILAVSQNANLILRVASVYIVPTVARTR